MSTLVSVKKFVPSLQSQSQNNSPCISKSSTSTKTVTQLGKIENISLDMSYPKPYDFGEENNPDTISITYKNDLNIMIIHDTIRKKFSNSRSKLNQHKKDIERLTKSLQFSTSINDSRCIMEEIKELENLTLKINTGSDWEDYKNDAEQYLIAYIYISDKKTSNVISVGKKVKTCVDIEIQERRLNIIDEYIKIAKKYININSSKIIKLQVNCPICGMVFKDVNDGQDNGLFTCQICGWYRENLAKSVFSKEGGKTSAGSKNDYNDRENFTKAVIRYSCKQSKNFNENLFQDLDEYFVNNKMRTGEEIRARPGKKSEISFQIMLKALTTLSRPKKSEHLYRKCYSDYYEDIRLIMHNYWGYPISDITHLLPKLLNIYNSTQEYYNSLTTDERGGRDAALNTQFRLLVQLKALNYPCNKKDFKIQSSRESLENHQNLWKKMCEATGITFHQII